MRTSYMSIDLGGRNAFVPQKVLDVPYIRSLFQQVGGIAMAYHMWRDLLEDAGLSCCLVDHLLKAF